MRGIYFRIFFIAIFALISARGSAQYYMTGSAKAGIKWRKIEGKYYNLVYPAEIDSMAQRYMWLLDSGKESVMYSVADEAERKGVSRINVILHPYTTQSNGMVAWAPKRMELYTRPPANGLYSQPWEEQLALHEARHVGQMAAFTKGLYRPLSYIFGEQITGLGVGIFMRRWFLEGDAVVAETSLSQSGRGRNASFLEYHRAAAIKGDTRSYERWYFGSNKYYTPNQYPFGYIIVSSGRILSGDYNFSGKLLNRISAQFYNPNTVNKNYKELTGYSRRYLFYAGFDYYANYWKSEWQSRGEFTLHSNLSAKRKSEKYYAEYRSPIVLDKDTILCIKYSYLKPTHLLLKTPGQERLLRSFSSSTSNLALNGDDILWTESVPDARWELGSVERLMAYNLKNKKVRPISAKESYYNPAVGQDGRVAVVEYPVTGGSNLVLLSGDKYQKELSFSAPNGGQITEAAYAAGKWHVLEVTDKGVGLYALLESGWSEEIAPHYSSMTSLRGYKDLLYFVSDIDGVNNVYGYYVNEQKVERLTNSEFGVDDPYLFEGELYYSSLDTDARHLVKSPYKKENNGLNVSFVNGVIKSDYRYELAEIVAEQENEAFKLNRNYIENSGEIPHYKSKRYSKVTHLFNFHSWMPFYLNVDKIRNEGFDNLYEVVLPGATLYSQNLLGTMRSMFGYSYRKGHHAAHASVEYRGLYPVFRLNVDYNEENRSVTTFKRNEELYVVTTRKSNKSLLELTATAYIPFNFSSRGWVRNLTPQAYLQYNNNKFYSLSQQKYINRMQLLYGLQYYQARESTLAAVYPKWGFGLSAMGLLPLVGKDDFSSVASLQGYLYLPGPFYGHGIRLRAGIQSHEIEGRAFYSDNILDMPRGYDVDFWGKKYYLFSVDYAMPFNLRGCNLGWFAYIKQIKFIPFADISVINDIYGVEYNHNSVGFDLLFNTHFFRLGSAVDIGFRYANRLNIGGNHFALLFSVPML